jgi:hypothetical protein
MSYYPKSESGQQCIGPCYPKNQYYIHPATLNVVVAHNMDSCPTNHYEENGKIFEFDKCSLIDGQNNNNSNYIIPHFDYMPSTFLKLIYDIKSYQEWINYLNIIIKKKIIL